MKAIYRQLHGFGIIGLLEAQQSHTAEQPVNHSSTDESGDSTQRQ